MDFGLEHRLDLCASLALEQAACMSTEPGTGRDFRHTSGKTEGSGPLSFQAVGTVAKHSHAVGRGGRPDEPAVDLVGLEVAFVRAG